MLSEPTLRLVPLPLTTPRRLLTTFRHHKWSSTAPKLLKRQFHVSCSTHVGHTAASHPFSWSHFLCPFSQPCLPCLLLAASLNASFLPSLPSPTCLPSLPCLPTSLPPSPHSLLSLPSLPSPCSLPLPTPHPLPPLPPVAQTANVTIGLVPVDYTTAAQHVNNVSMKLRAAAAKNPGAADKKMDRASLNRTNWALGLDDMMEEGHYTSQTMKVLRKGGASAAARGRLTSCHGYLPLPPPPPSSLSYHQDMWGTKLPPTAGQATAVRTRSGIKDARVVPPAVADDSPGWLSNLERMKRKPRSGGSSATDSKGSALSRAGAQVATS